MNTNERRILAVVINDARTEVVDEDFDVFVDGEAGAEIACNFIAAKFADELVWDDPEYTEREFLLKCGAA